LVFYSSTRITNDEVFQKTKEERLISKVLKNGGHSCIGPTVRHNEFVVNILERAIFGRKKKPWEVLDYNTSKQVARNTAADSHTAMKRMACNKS